MISKLDRILLNQRAIMRHLLEIEVEKGFALEVALEGTKELFDADVAESEAKITRKAVPIKKGVVDYIMNGDTEVAKSVPDNSQEGTHEDAPIDSVERASDTPPDTSTQVKQELDKDYEK